MHHDRSVSRRRRGAALPSLGLILTLSVAVALPGSAAPCCVGGTCEDLTPADCAAADGLAGHCVVGEACGGAACDGALVAPITDLRVSRGGPDVLFRWTADPFADLYRTAWDLAPSAVADCDAPGFPAVGWPSTVAEWVHANAVTGTPGVLFYCVNAACVRPPARGACCTADVCTEDVTREDCEAGGGAYLGDDTDCALDPCTPTGACCMADACTEGVTQVACETGGGTYLGDDTDCALDPCAPTGACCTGTDCTDAVTQPDCEAGGGTYVGDGTDCASDPCLPRGACCTADVCAEDVTQVDCEVGGGTYLGDGTDCTLDPCTPRGACCTALGCTDDVTRPDCEASGGVYQGDGTTCAVDPCTPATGACCTGGCCAEGVLQADCEVGGGTYMGDDTTCAPDPCGGPTTGSCCVGSACSEDVTLADCRRSGGAWNGLGSSCATAPCTSVVTDPTPCLITGTVLYFDGDPTDYIHPGEDTIVNATWSVTNTPDQVHVNCRPDDPGQGLWWDVYVSSEELPGPLVIGVYEDAQRWPFEDLGRPGLSVSGDGRGCNRLSGRFEILALTRDCDGEIQAFTATWEQHCEEGVPAHRGCVHYER